MSKRVYISADYSEDNGDREVVELLNKWGSDLLHKVDFIDTAKVKSGSVSKDENCRPCDLKKEFNRQINASSAVIFVVGDKTASRVAGSNCSRMSTEQIYCSCTPYKQNANGTKICKIPSVVSVGENDDVGEINSYSYLKHEFLQAIKKNKTIIIFYNSLYKQPSWLPIYMKEYEYIAQPFWVKNYFGDKVGNYSRLKEVLGYG